MAGFGLSGSLWSAVLFLALGGAADFVGMVFRSAMLQTAATDETRGRLQGVLTVSAVALLPAFWRHRAPVVGKAEQAGKVRSVPATESADGSARTE